VLRSEVACLPQCCTAGAVRRSVATARSEACSARSVRWAHSGRPPTSHHALRVCPREYSYLSQGHGYAGRCAVEPLVSDRAERRREQEGQRGCAQALYAWRGEAWSVMRGVAWRVMRGMECVARWGRALRTFGAPGRLIMRHEPVTATTARDRAEYSACKIKPPPLPCMWFSE
jgi:hypothetical protein